jgi:RNA polymerase sigma-70 factor (ECF subfamily)
LEKATQRNSVFFLDGEYSELIGNIRKGDVSSLAALYDKTGRLLFGLILKILGDRGLAEETLLDVYTCIWQEIASGGSGHLSIERLLTAARTHAIARLHWKKQSRKKHEFSTVLPDSTATVVPEEQKLARSAWESLTPVQQEILNWIFYSELSVREIAAQIGKPHAAVRTHACLGLIQLSQRVQPLFKNDPESTVEAH